MVRFRTLKNSYLKLKERYTHTITEEEARERYFTKILDEAIEEFRKNSRTTSLEQWRKEMREEFNVIL